MKKQSKSEFRAAEIDRVRKLTNSDKGDITFPILKEELDNRLKAWLS